MFAADPGFELLGEAADGAEAVRLAQALEPDVILMDLRMPGMDA
jgi:YesN/AraC family two-component response regulator